MTDKFDGFFFVVLEFQIIMITWINFLYDQIWSAKSWLTSWEIKQLSLTLGQIFEEKWDFTPILLEAGGGREINSHLQLGIDPDWPAGAPGKIREKLKIVCKKIVRHEIIWPDSLVPVPNLASRYHPEKF